MITNYEVEYDVIEDRHFHKPFKSTYFQRRQDDGWELVSISFIPPSFKDAQHVVYWKRVKSYIDEGI